jgi:hypothetical protein
MTTPSDLDKLSAEAREKIGAMRSSVIRRADKIHEHMRLARNHLKVRQKTGSRNPVWQ